MIDEKMMRALLNYAKSLFFEGIALTTLSFDGPRFHQRPRGSLAGVFSALPDLVIPNPLQR
jgi:hypothetical protein